MLNMNFAERVVIDTEQLAWQQSPMPGVLRKPLSRGGEESGHATSLVQYAAGSFFKVHSHPHGEEILVLDGIFSDESGDYGPGSYLRNPPGSQHQPFSQKGCTLFVKLAQFQSADLATVRIDTNNAQWRPGHGGLSVMPLHSFETEHTALVRWPAGEVFLPHRHYGGEEILVLSGTFSDEYGDYSARHWLRNPHLSQHTPFVREETVILVKTGQLLQD